jgi:hypothetical protein
MEPAMPAVYGNKLPVAIKSNVLDPDQDWTQVQTDQIDTEHRQKKDIFIIFYV